MTNKQFISLYATLKSIRKNLNNLCQFTFLTIKRPTSNEARAIITDFHKRQKESTVKNKYRHTKRILEIKKANTWTDQLQKVTYGKIAFKKLREGAEEKN